MMPAFADTCNTPGYYLNENNECVACKNSEIYYCPGDGTRVPCPGASLSDYQQRANDTFTSATITSFNGPFAWASDGKPSSFSNCYTDIFIETEKGSLLMECAYDTNRQYWCPAYQYYWYEAKPGYYLSNFRWESYHAWYYSVQECTNSYPEHAHWADETPPDNPNCLWACDDGYGRHGDECLPLCGAGVTTLHAGNEVVFNVYRDKLSTPSINIKYNNTVCYVNLAQGTGQLNFRYNNTTYHATD